MDNAQATTTSPPNPASGSTAGFEEITGAWTLADVLKKYPCVAEVMMKYGMHCFGCGVSYYESVEQGAKSYGNSDEQIAQMLREMNDAARNAGFEENKPVSISAKAVEKLHQFMQGKPMGLRVNVASGGCAGMSYGLELQNEPDANDDVLEDKGIRVFLPREHRALLEGIKIDYVDTLQGAGFKILNPNATKSCGCGQSFH